MPKFDFKKLSKNIKSYLKDGFEVDDSVSSTFDDIRNVTAGVGIHEILPYEEFDEKNRIFFNTDRKSVV